MSVIVVVLMTGILLGGCGAVERVLDWTVDGVRNYTTQPLEVMFGDVLTFKCDPNIISNFVYVETREQYDSCDSEANDGKSLKSGDCLARFSASDSFEQKIQRLSGTGQDAVVEYQAGQYFYFFSSSNGSLGFGNSPYVGGQCLNGLKMVVFVVGLSPSPFSTTTTFPSPTVSISSGGDGTLLSTPSPSPSTSPTLSVTAAASATTTAQTVVCLCSLFISHWNDLL